MLSPNKASERVISRERQLKKFGEIVFLTYTEKGIVWCILKDINPKNIFLLYLCKGEFVI